MENSMEILCKAKSRNTKQLSNMTSRYLSADHENANLKSYMQPYL